MPVPFPRLFEPGRIGTLELRNRILKAPQSTALGNLDGTVSDRTVRHYRELARGGTGLVMCEYTYVDEIASKSAQCQLGASSNDHVPGLSWLAAAVKEEGAAIGLQIEHCGRQKFLGTPPLKAASAKPWPALYELTGVVPEVLTTEEIAAIVEAFGDAARRAVLAGYDLVEIHGAHGYLITNFLSTHTNDRTDEYGGPLENRMRFLLEVVANVRAKVPPGFPVTVRLSGTDYEPDGIQVEETVEVARALERAGIDAIHVSGGDHHTMVMQVSPFTIPRMPNVWAAERIRQGVGIPVIASGSITLPRYAEEILAAGKADFVALGRPLLADPAWPRKAAAGREQDIRPCIRCNDGCLDRTFMRFRSIRCSVNPDMGREGEQPVVPAAAPRRVAVVGGGPAGMEAARVAALRGHDVTLFERRRLGGALVEAAAASFKTDLLPLVDNLVFQLGEAGVAVVDAEATVGALRDGGFDAVVVATGGRPRAAELPGGGLEQRDALSVLRDAAGLGTRVAVVGGGHVGTETALHLAESGHEVTLVEAGPAVMATDVLTDRIMYGQRLGELGVTTLTGTRATGTAPAGLLVEGPDGAAEIPADAVVVAVGTEPDHGLADELRAGAPGVEVHLVGNAARAGRVYDAIHAGFLAGLRI